MKLDSYAGCIIAVFTTERASPIGNEWQPHLVRMVTFVGGFNLAHLKGFCKGWGRQLT